MKKEGPAGRNRTQSLANTTRPNRFPNFKTSAHNFFVNAILKRVTNTQAAVLRRKAAQQLSNGNASPFLALVGVSLASGTGIITKQDELDCICREIQKAAAKTLENTEAEVRSNHNGKSWTLKDFEFGPVIAKGCNAVVHAAKMTFSGFQKMAVTDQNHQDNEIVQETRDLSEMKDPKGARYETESKASTSSEKYPLAIKMMFNYEAESNAMAILNTMYRETVPVKTVDLPQEITEWCNIIQDQRITLPPHPNIADMQLAFVDRIPSLDGCFKLYPEALPRR